MRSDVLIDVSELRGLLGRPRLVVLDVRWALDLPDGREAYLAGHIPGAVYVDLPRELASWPPAPGRGRHPLPEIEELQASVRRWGIDPGDLVVAYDHVGGASAARAWWLLRWGGLRDVRLLDGGLGAWRAAGLELQRGETAVAPGRVKLSPGHMPLLDAEGAARLAREGVLLDARAPERYRGEVEPVDPRAGHIPGAINAPTSDNLKADGTFLAPARLAERFGELGVRAGAPVEADAGRASGPGGPSGPGEPGESSGSSAPSGSSGPSEGPAVGVYCGSGVSATHTIAALMIAGMPPAALYPGSWSEWCADPSRPVRTGAAP